MKNQHNRAWGICGLILTSMLLVNSVGSIPSPVHASTSSQSTFNNSANNPDASKANMGTMLPIKSLQPLAKVSTQSIKGEWGTVAWSIDTAGVLHLNAGTGDSDFPVFPNTRDRASPWYAYKDSIKSISIDGKVILPVNSSNLFFCLDKTTKIDHMENLDFSNTTNISFMFSHMDSLESLDLSHADTSNVHDMRSLFSGGAVIDVYGSSVLLQKSTMALKNITFGGAWNTENVSDMSFMFQHVGNIVNLDLSSFNTKNVTTMERLLDYPFDVSINDAPQAQLTTLNLGENFNTSKVTNMSSTFANNPNLKNLDVSKFDTSRVSTMNGTFQFLSSLDSLDVSKWDTSKATDMAYLFYGMNNVKALNVSQFITSNVRNMDYMFGGDSKLKMVDLSGFNTSRVSNPHNLFYNDNSGDGAVDNDSLEEVIFGPNFNTSQKLPNATNDLHWLSVGTGSTSVPEGNIDLSTDSGTLTNSVYGGRQPETYVLSKPISKEQSIDVEYVNETNQVVHSDKITGTLNDTLNSKLWNYQDNGYDYSSSDVDKDLQVSNDMITGKYTSTKDSSNQELNQKITIHLTNGVAKITAPNIDFGTHEYTDKSFDSENEANLSVYIPKSDINSHIELSVGEFSNNLSLSDMSVEMGESTSSLDDTKIDSFGTVSINESSKQVSNQLTKTGTYNIPIKAHMNLNDGSYSGEHTAVMTYSLVNAPN